MDEDSGDRATKENSKFHLYISCYLLLEFGNLSSLFKRFQIQDIGDICFKLGCKSVMIMPTPGLELRRSELRC